MLRSLAAPELNQLKFAAGDVGTSNFGKLSYEYFRILINLYGV